MAVENVHCEVVGTLLRQPERVRRRDSCDGGMSARVSA
jgi:hypothetical protein